MIFVDGFAPAPMSYPGGYATHVWHNWKAIVAVSNFQKVPTMVRLDASVSLQYKLSVSAWFCSKRIAASRFLFLAELF